MRFQNSMVAGLRQFVERRVIGDSVPRLVRWGKSLPPTLIRRMQADAFRRVVRYADSRQRFLSRAAIFSRLMLFLMPS